MPDDLAPRTLPLPHLKAEGAPLHPDDINYVCDCPMCRIARARQRKAYNDWYRAKLGDAWTDE